MTRSLKKWSDKANINFVELPPTPDGPPVGSSQIRVRFETGNHGDGFPFDGPSGTLAHAFFPLNNAGKVISTKYNVHVQFRGYIWG